DQMAPGSVAVFPSAPVRSRNSDVDYEYRQDSDFYYLTAFEEPESFCVLMPSHEKYNYVLFVRPRNKEMEAWTGLRSGEEGAIESYRADMAFPNTRFEEILSEFLQNASALYYTLHRYPDVDQKIFHALETVKQKSRLGIYPPPTLIDPSALLSEMRLVKQPEELEMFRKAVDISAKAHLEAMKTTSPGKFEYEIQAVLEYVFRTNGSRRNGYPCIVGSGPNTCILHYNENNRQMQAADLLLVDAGAEYEYYTGDITRTYPVNGKFSSEQRAVYEVVLNAQKKAIDAVRPGVTFMQVHSMAVSELTGGLISVGLLPGTVEENIESEAYKKYYLHRTGHWLGMDVHDVGRYKKEDQWRTLQPGMVLTVEPGLYINEEDEHERFRNIGIRIEDDVLVTENDPIILSAACPKQIQDLEAIVGTRPWPKIM
ncbi:MAG TPA: aminopeptidase P N-terminal domain-containing protein, partial [Acidobacteriota bacterium]|nr:aminopeptidase P N-terminal domain-containing protein [Acidobacteriota bacterium]